MLTKEESYIFDLAQNPQHAGELVDATLTLEGANLSCGDEIVLYLELSNDVIASAKHSSRACAVCVAGAEMLIEEIIGKEVKKTLEITNEEIIKKFPIELSPTRQKCATLALQTLRGLKKT